MNNDPVLLFAVSGADLAIGLSVAAMGYGAGNCDTKCDQNDGLALDVGNWRQDPARVLLEVFGAANGKL